MHMRKPIIGIPADRRLLNSHWFHCVGEKYVNAVVQAADAVPVLVPALGDRYLREWLVAFDGILFTGSPSNVEPHRYLGPKSAPGTWHDPERDATTLPMITGAVEAGLPILGICRGFQEINVALGGSLHQNLQDLPGNLDHREKKDQSLDEQYGPVHDIELVEGGILHKIAGTRHMKVNSLHAQGVERLAPTLVPEAKAEDGVIEAFRIDGAKAFALAVQWHPEWKVMENPFSRALFAEFGKAGRAHAIRRAR
jgi:putative glutamine amidotransferase